MKRIKAKLIFAVISISVSTPLALVTTYLYGEFHQHDRYWEGTIARVNERYAEIINAIITQIPVEDLALENQEIFFKLFEPLNGLLSITLLRGEEVIFDNRYSDRDLKEPLMEKQFGNLAITVAPYQPPVWADQMVSWILTPQFWFTYRSDFITYPFLSFLCIYLVMSLALGWKIRAGYLEHDVLDRMNRN